MREDGPVTTTTDTQSRRGFASPADIARSMGLVLLIIVAVMLLIPSRNKNVQVIDYSNDLRVARSAAPFHVVAPTGLGAGWRATNVLYSGSGPSTLWHLGFVSPKDAFTGVDQLAAPSAADLRHYTHSGTKDGTVQIGGKPWQRWYASEAGVRALVMETGDSTVVVSGMTSSYDPLVELASSLR